MKFQTPQNYQDFICLAGDCPDTCCKGWEVVIDSHTKACYNRTPGAFGAQLKKAMMVDVDGDTIFKNIGPRCPFLTPKNLCAIYTTLGAQALSETCRLYPRFSNTYGLLQEAGLSLSCPEATRMIFENPEPITFQIQNNNTPQVVDETPDAKILDRMLQARSAGIALLQNRNFSFNQRLALLLDFALKLTQGLFTADDASEKALCQGLCTQEILRHRLEALVLDTQPTDNRLLINLFEFLKTCEHRTPAFTQEIHTVLDYLKSDKISGTALFQKRPGQEHYDEHMGVYSLFRYFLESVWSYEPLISVQQTIFISLAIATLGAVQEIQSGHNLTPDAHQKIIIYFSREMEHSLSNMEKIEDALFSKDLLEAKALLAFLLGC